MKSALFAQAMAASMGRMGPSPAQQEKDRAVELARALLRGELSGLSSGEQFILARQLMRALALPA